MQIVGQFFKSSNSFSKHCRFKSQSPKEILNKVKVLLRSIPAMKTQPHQQWQIKLCPFIHWLISADWTCVPSQNGGELVYLQPYRNTSELVSSDVLTTSITERLKKVNTSDNDDDNNNYYDNDQSQTQVPN